MFRNYYNDNYYHDLVALIKQKISNNIVKLLDQVTNISKILNKCEIGVLSSSIEGLPVSLIEYGLAELPVVCTDVGQCSKVIQNRVRWNYSTT